MTILEGAIVGGVIGLVVVLVTNSQKEQKFKKLIKTVSEPVDYSALYHYASFKRYKNSFKFFDSYGALYLVGKTVFYKASETEPPISFNLNEYYFNSNKMGGFKNNSEETLKGLAAIQARKSAV